MITLLEITQADVILHEQREYNPYIWNQTVKRYAERNARFYTSINQSQYGYRTVYAIYMVDGFRVIQEVTYSSSLTSAPMQSYQLIKNKWLNKLPYKFKKDSLGRRMAKSFSLQDKSNMVGDYLLGF